LSLLVEYLSTFFGPVFKTSQGQTRLAKNGELKV